MKKEIPTRATSDASKVKDALGLDTYLKGLADYIKECEMPMTISIQGDWGTGKTTFFNLVKARLEEEGTNIPIVEVNTWQFSVAGYENEMVYALIQSICNELEKLMPEEPETSNSFKNCISNIRTSISAMGPLAVKLPVAAVLENVLGSTVAENVLAYISEMGENVQQKESGIDAIDTLRENMKNAIAKVCETCDAKKLLVFIDDLDRLEPKSAVELLEGLKNFLDCDKCVFVLALDQKVVFRGVEAKYGKENGKDLGSKFFDKIIQLPFTLPMASYDISEYIEKLRPNDTWQTQERFLEVVECLTDKNPRTIKRLFNMLLLREKTEGIDSEDTNKKVLLLAILALSLKNDDAYKALVEQVNIENRPLKEYICQEKGDHDYADLKKIMDSVTNQIGDEEMAYQLLTKLIKGSVSTTAGEKLNVGNEIAPLFRKFSRLIRRNTRLENEEAENYKKIMTQTFTAKDGAYVRLSPNENKDSFNIILHDSEKKYNFYERIQQDNEFFVPASVKDIKSQKDKLLYRGSEHTVTIIDVGRQIDYYLLGHLYDEYIANMGC